MMKTLSPLPLMAAAGLFTLAACSDGQDDVVQAPADAVPAQSNVEPVSEGLADHVRALGMTSEELEDADLLSAQRTDLGDVERVIVDADNAVTGFVIELEGPDDRYVVIPIDQVTSTESEGEKDLMTELNVDEVTRLPPWDRPAA